MNGGTTYTPREWAEALADRLGYLKHDDALRINWSVFLLSPSPGSATAGRAERETSGLFDSLRDV